MPKRLTSNDLDIDLAEVREWCRIDTEAEDQLLASSLRAAQAVVELATDLPIPRGTWQQRVALGATCYIIPNPPLVSVDAVLDAEGASLTGWEIDETGQLPVVTLPTGAVEIRWTAGWTELPHDVALAIKQLTAHFLDQPMAATPTRLEQLPMGARYILDSLRLRRAI